MVFTLPILAQSADPSATFVDALPRIAALVVFVAILLAILAFVRHRLRADDGGVARDFTLGDLRRLRAEGKLTDDELNRAKSALVGRTHATLAADAKPTTPHAQPIDAEFKA